MIIKYMVLCHREFSYVFTKKKRTSREKVFLFLSSILLSEEEIYYKLYEVEERGRRDS